LIVSPGGGSPSVIRHRRPSETMATAVKFSAAM
jgi:hypothetical protein